MHRVRLIYYTKNIIFEKTLMGYIIFEKTLMSYIVVYTLHFLSGLYLTHNNTLRGLYETLFGIENPKTIGETIYNPSRRSTLSLRVFGI